MLIAGCRCLFSAPMPPADTAHDAAGFRLLPRAAAYSSAAAAVISRSVRRGGPISAMFIRLFIARLFDTTFDCRFRYFVIARFSYRVSLLSFFFASAVAASYFISRLR